MAAPSNGRVLISGENGTGKELVARQIHALSHRRAGPFIEVNCAAIPEELIESELFGHTQGRVHRRGRRPARQVRDRDGGTLFLDEVGDMSLKTQAKVLRALQEQIVEPVGGQQQRARRRARDRRDQQGPRRRDPARPVPRGPLFPPERHPDLRAAAARARRRRDPAGRALRRRVRARVRPAAEDALAGRARCCCGRTAGPATCANCAT